MHGQGVSLSRWMCIPIDDLDGYQDLEDKEKDAQDMALYFQDFSNRVKAYAEIVRTSSILAEQQQASMVQSAHLNLKSSLDRLNE
jgi:hypothetical protein